jgi:hypothetical protein
MAVSSLGSPLFPGSEPGFGFYFGTFPGVNRAQPRIKKCGARAFSSEVDTGSREENASKQESRASVLILSEPKL